jgi:hypothetical protein
MSEMEQVEVTDAIDIEFTYLSSGRVVSPVPSVQTETLG